MSGTALVEGIAGHPGLVAGVASTYAERVRGLMWSEPRNLLFVFPVPQHVCLHMFQVSFEITALMLDDTFRVLEVIELKPGDVRCFRAHGRYVLELAGQYWIHAGAQLEITIS